MRVLHALWFPVLIASVSACGGGNTPAGGGTTTPGATSKPVNTGPASPDSDKVTWKRDSPKNCHTGNKGDGDLVAAVTSMATACVGGKMKQVGAPLTGEGGSASSGHPGEMIKQFPFKAQANKCYRVFGISPAATVKDFDIAIVDSATKDAAEDLTDGNDAIVLEDGAVCFKVDDDVNINVAVGEGYGKWAVVIFSD
jgi:hypothetical protein